ncbi:protein PIF-like [Mya arenaria]|uniref:protein PIF-like n=1 Tax=Mya arenaria TaxID=6604 RepID=UPI0022E2BE5A|nr:protein PIF-like [Mya arenaria]
MMAPSFVVHILCVLWMARVTPGQEYTAVCDEETMKLRVGYKEHPTDCSKYIQCMQNKEGQYVGFVRDCGYGTYWNPTVLTCILATDTVCKHDLCYQQPDGKRRNGLGNCRGFYECRGSSSIPMCCPFGQYFHESLECVNTTVDIKCNQRCMDTIVFNQTNEQINDFVGDSVSLPFHSQMETMLTGVSVISDINQKTPADQLVKGDVNSDTGGLKVKPIVSRVNPSQAAGSVCDKSAVPNNPDLYKQTLYGGDWIMERSCPAGTMFVQAVCNCINIVDQTEILALTRSVNNKTQTTMCSPIIHLPFTLDHKDQSGNAYEIINHNVTVRNGKAIFHGYENFLTISNFSSVNITTSLVIKVIYSSDHESIPKNQLMSIFSNYGCNEASSIYMYENVQYIFSGVGLQTDANKLKYTYVRQRPPPPGGQTPTKEVFYMFNDRKFTLKNGDTSNSVPAEGNFNKIACPLKIGHGANITPFKGEIDEFTVYVC